MCQAPERAPSVYGCTHSTSWYGSRDRVTSSVV